MVKTQAQSSIKKIQNEATTLSPSTLIHLFEIDTSTIARDTGVITSGDLLNADSSRIFRFHNNVFLLNKSIFWQGREYIAAPIGADGFEINSAETVPTPKLQISTSNAGIESLAILKQKIFEMGDLVGAKVTRIRTFLKYLDARNFPTANRPVGYDPDPNAEFPRDVFYVDRKSLENKTTIEYTLATLMDVEDVKLPGRLAVANTCTFFYRGQGCYYEYNARRNDAVHGTSSESTLPELAPAVANERDELITDVVGVSAIVDRGEYQPSTPYSRGDAIFVEKNGRKYYFVAKENSPTYPPPNVKSWESDTCSKTIRGCGRRWGTSGSVLIGVDGIGLSKGNLRMGAFPGMNKVR